MRALLVFAMIWGAWAGDEDAPKPPPTKAKADVSAPVQVFQRDNVMRGNPADIAKRVDAILSVDDTSSASDRKGEAPSGGK